MPTDTTSPQPSPWKGEGATVPISVIIPTYNRRESLRLTLDGLSRQTMPMNSFEVVVVSDGSTDGTTEFLTEYAASAPYRFRPIIQENAGPSAARNRAIRESAGEVIVLLDDDVEPDPSFLAAHAARHDNIDKLVVIGPMLRDPARREPIWVVWEHLMLRKQYDSWENGAWSTAGPHNFYSGNASVRREWIMAVDGFDESLKRMEDVDLARRMERECGVRFEYDPRPAGIHRPIRSVESWLAVAEAYGRLDVVCARTGAGSWDAIRKRYADRNLATRLLSRAMIAVPALATPIRSLLMTSARIAYACGSTNAAMVALSVVCNLRYLESAGIEMGWDALRRVIDDAPTPATAP